VTPSPNKKSTLQNWYTQTCAHTHTHTHTRTHAHAHATQHYKAHTHTHTHAHTHTHTQHNTIKLNAKPFIKVLRVILKLSNT